MPRFEKGNQFSTGRPRGAHNKNAAWLEKLAEGDTDEVIEVVRDRAKAGDMRAAAIMLRRTWPQRRGRTVRLDLPAVDTTGGLVGAQAAVVAAMSRGELTPDEAASVATVLETQRRAIETHDHERRIQELEEDARNVADKRAAGSWR